jgi:hypothetical protein
MHRLWVGLIRLNFFHCVWIWLIRLDFFHATKRDASELDSIDSNFCHATKSHCVLSWTQSTQISFSLAEKRAPDFDATPTFFTQRQALSELRLIWLKLFSRDEKPLRLSWTHSTQISFFTRRKARAWFGLIRLKLFSRCFSELDSFDSIFHATKSRCVWIGLIRLKIILAPESLTQILLRLKKVVLIWTHSTQIFHSHPNWTTVLSSTRILTRKTVVTIWTHLTQT